MGKSHPNVDDYVVSRVRALESLLVEKGILPPDAVDRVIRQVRVWDTASESCDMVVPGLPAGQEQLSEEDLAPHATCETLIGMAEVRLPPASV